MKRIPEPELMEDEAQAQAYAEADFSEPNSHFIELLQAAFPPGTIKGHVLDLGCGPGDITLRVAQAWPSCTVHGVDGAAAMLQHGQRALSQAGLGERVQFIHGRLPEVRLPRGKYDVLISNSLLHHLLEPAVLWDCLKRYGARGAPVFIMDLRRPATRHEVKALVEHYGVGEPEILQRDFFNSLLAAFEPEEVQGQLVQAGLDSLQVEVASDRHLTISGLLAPS
ncbi:class I SAM-dependent methyltransferase [Nitrosococcus wardiae]|uniref:Class I SAM-dependent methyltransferase n=1 Tax=Nitrosococcus wardiae TaxID=1814290 RepID=A0A4P7BZG1_9GAMM|nr:class I SAM-dependent methyltransferase [Nitrosococcus wardiae]QBQ53912.1 class I SAM-dependent methyltransferase [Nitrosococcus wardiae]